MSQLAILGGEKLLREPVKVLTWPERNEQTAERLKEVYLSGDWSFNSLAEQQFEHEFAAYHGARHAVFMMNGTVTLECALQAVGVKRGDEVIVPALTWMATAMAAYYLGAVPVFVDIEPSTLCLDPARLEAAITSRTRAIIPVHLSGSTADLEKILAIADSHGIPVVEDCAHMQGGFWNKRGVGGWGKVGSFSFQQSKSLSCGEGGICITNDEELAKKLYLLKHIGYGRGLKQGEAVKAPEGLICHNYRATAFQAVILSEQLKRLPDRIRRYNESARIMTEAISGISGVRVQSKGRLAEPQGYYCFHYIFDGEEFLDIPLKAIYDACTAEGVSVGNSSYGPVYKHNLFNLRAHEYRIAAGSCPVSESLSPKRMLGVSHQTLYYRETAEQIGAVMRKVTSNLDELRTYAAQQGLC